MATQYETNGVWYSGVSCAVFIHDDTKLRIYADRTARNDTSGTIFVNVMYMGMKPMGW